MTRQQKASRAANAVLSAKLVTASEREKHTRTKSFASKVAMSHKTLVEFVHRIRLKSLHALDSYAIAPQAVEIKQATIPAEGTFIVVR